MKENNFLRGELSTHLFIQLINTENSKYIFYYGTGTLLGAKNSKMNKKVQIFLQTKTKSKMLH